MKYHITESVLAYYVQEAINFGIACEDLSKNISNNLMQDIRFPSRNISIENVYPILSILYDSGYQNKTELILTHDNNLKTDESLHDALCCNSPDINNLILFISDVCKKNFSNFILDFNIHSNFAIYNFHYIDNKASFFSPQSLFVMISTLLKRIFDIDPKEENIEFGFPQNKIPDPDGFSYFATDKFRTRSSSIYIKIPLSLIHKKNNNHNPLLSNFLNKEYNSYYLTNNNTEKFALKVSSCVSNFWSQGQSININLIAQELGLSRASLYRQLSKNNITFSSIVESQRREYAIKYVKDNNLSIADISDRLGYANVSAFNRAFKRWFNVTPSHFRI